MNLREMFREDLAKPLLIFGDHEKALQNRQVCELLAWAKKVNTPAIIRITHMEEFTSAYLKSITDVGQDEVTIIITSMRDSWEIRLWGVFNSCYIRRVSPSISEGVELIVKTYTEEYLKLLTRLTESNREAQAFTITSR